MQLLYIDPRNIERDPHGVREDDGDVDGLAETIRDQGLLQPLGVVPIGRERYRVVFGGRRLGAALHLGLEQLPCVILDPEDPDLFIRQLIENLQRRDLNDIEKARGFLRLREQFVERTGALPEGELDERIGHAAGIAARTVRRYLGLLDLPDDVQHMIRDDELSVTQAQHLRRISSAKTQIELARLVADEGLSAAEVSRLANYFAANPNLTVDSALNALQSGAELRTEASPISSASAPLAQPPVGRAEPGDDDLWADEAEGEDADQQLGQFDEPDDASRTKARVFRIRSLDQMVDETDRLARALHEGDLTKWALSDEAAPFKIRLLLKQLRSLSQALESLAGEQGWGIQD